MAIIHLPNAKMGKITEGSPKPANGDNFKNIRADGQAAKMEVGSGFYTLGWMMAGRSVKNIGASNGTNERMFSIMLLYKLLFTRFTGCFSLRSK